MPKKKRKTSWPKERILRLKGNMSDTAFGAAIGVSATTIFRWSVGQTSPGRLAQHSLNEYAAEKVAKR